MMAAISLPDGLGEVHLRSLTGSLTILPRHCLESYQRNNENQSCFILAITVILILAACAGDFCGADSRCERRPHFSGEHGHRGTYANDASFTATPLPPTQTPVPTLALPTETPTEVFTTDPTQARSWNSCLVV